MYYVYRLIFLALFLPCLCTGVRAQTLVTQDSSNMMLDSTVELTLREQLTSLLWEDTLTGYLMRFDPYGPFEEDAGDRRKVRYLKGQWKLDSTETYLTLAVDKFLAEGLVHRRYRAADGDYYVPYVILAIDDEQLLLEDRETGKLRYYRATRKADHDESAERQFPVLSVPSGPTLKLPKGW